MLHEQLEELARKHGATSYRNRADTQNPAYGFTPAGLLNLLAEVTGEARQQAIKAEREACAQACDRLALGTLEAQSGSTDALENVMLRQVATLGHSECAAAIRARRD